MQIKNAFQLPLNDIVGVTKGKGAVGRYKEIHNNNGKGMAGESGRLCERRSQRVTSHVG